MTQNEHPWRHIVSIDELEDETIRTFSCGEEYFDTWLHQNAKKAAARDECMVHVCIDGGGKPVAYFTLSATSINPDEVSSNARGGLHGPIPAILLGKMAVSSQLRINAGCGTHVLRHAMRYAVKSAAIVSARLLVVDAYSPGLIDWYVKRGFTSLPNMPNRLVCKMSKARKICFDLGEAYFVR